MFDKYLHHFNKCIITNICLNNKAPNELYGLLCIYTGYIYEY